MSFKGYTVHGGNADRTEIMWVVYLFYQICNSDDPLLSESTQTIPNVASSQKRHFEKCKYLS